MTATALAHHFAVALARTPSFLTRAQGACDNANNFMGGGAIGYLPIFIFIAAAILFGGGTLAISYFVQSRVFNKTKSAPYECGSEPISDARIPYPARYYIIAVLFVIFDIEIVFLYPWAVAFHKIGLFGLVSMLIFIALFVLGFVYAWRKGGLEWD